MCGVYFCILFIIAYFFALFNKAPLAVRGVLNHSVPKQRLFHFYFLEGEPDGFDWRRTLCAFILVRRHKHIRESDRVFVCGAVCGALHDRHMTDVFLILTDHAQEKRGCLVDSLSDDDRLILTLAGRLTGCDITRGIDTPTERLDFNLVLNAVDLQEIVGLCCGCRWNLMCTDRVGNRENSNKNGNDAGCKQLREICHRKRGKEIELKVYGDEGG